jgi:integrase
VASFRARQRKGGTFYTVYFKLDGVQVERSAGRDRALAKRWASRLTEQEYRRKAGFPDVDGPFRSTWPLSELQRRDLEECRLSGREVASRARRWRTIRAGFPGDPMLHQVTGPVAEGFRSARLKEAGPATVNRDLSVLSSAWALAMRFGEATENPWKSIPRGAEKATRRRSVALDEATSSKLIRLAWTRARRMKKYREPWQSAAIVEILFLTSSRLSQVLQLRRDQVAGNDLRFDPQKGGTDRVFDLSGRLGELVREAARRSADKTWLFPSIRRVGPRENIRKFWASLLEDAGIEDFHRHELRHSAATLAAYRGETIPQLQERMGHASPRMASEVYSHVHRRRIRAMAPRAKAKRRATG